MKKETLAQVFPCEFCEIFNNTFFYRKPPVAVFIGVVAVAVAAGIVAVIVLVH